MREMHTPSPKEREKKRAVEQREVNKKAGMKGRGEEVNREATGQSKRHRHERTCKSQNPQSQETRTGKRNAPDEDTPLPQALCYNPYHSLPAVGLCVKDGSGVK
jgi:hypothetical protein